MFTARVLLAGPTATELLLQQIAGLATGIQTASNPASAQQPPHSLNTLYEMATRSAPWYASQLEKVGARLGATVIVPRDNHGAIQLKPRPRSEALVSTGQRTSRQLTDLSRATMIVDYDRFAATIDALKAQYGAQNIVSATDRVNGSLAGYRGDFSLLIRDPQTGILHELLLMPHEVWRAREHGGHEIFERNRVLKAASALLPGPTSALNQAMIAQWDQETEMIYQNAQRNALDRVSLRFQRENHLPAEPRKLRVGIFSGTFSPPHLGHRQAVENFRRQFGLDKVYIITNTASPHKADVLAFPYRDAMSVRAFSSIPGAIVDDEDIEAAFKDKDMAGAYEKITEPNPGSEVFHLMGVDSFERYVGLNDRANIPGMTLVVAGTPNQGQLPATVDGHTVVSLQMAGIPEIHSTELRGAISAGSVPAQISPIVAGFIRDQHLYGAADCVALAKKVGPPPQIRSRR